jgi:putative RNA 2'-phosphotransferase
LRHTPERIGLELKNGGWVEIDKLLKACNQHNFVITGEELAEVVRNNDKQRFSFDETGMLIRANQGHTIKIDLQLQAQIPPAQLYHGTGEQFVNSIQKQGLQKMSRHHVHLSVDINTAIKVGQRKGKPVIFIIDAAKMYQDGYQFYRSDNGVWLVDFVPPEYLTYFN